MTVTVIQDANVPSRLTIQGVRLAYPHLNEPQQPQAGSESSEAKYNANLLIPNDQTQAIQQIQAAMWKLVCDEFGQQATAIWTELTAAGRLCMRDGNIKASADGFAGNQFIVASAKTTQPPALFDIFLDPQTQRPKELKRPQNRIYAGCYVNVQIGIWVQNNKFGRRVNCQLLAVQFAADGESFGGGAAPDLSVFGGVAEPVAAMSAMPGGTPGGAPGFALPGAAPQGYAPPGAALQGYALPGAALQGYAPPQAGFAPPVPAGAPGFAPPGAAPAFTPAANPGFAPPGAPPAPQGYAPPQDPSYVPPGNMPPGYQGI